MKLIKENEKWKVYDIGEFKIYYRNEGSISWDNNINEKEEIYLIEWEAEIHIEDNINIINWPSKIIIPKKTYHKIIARSKIIFLLKN